MSKGTVKFFNEAKGFGFIKDEETSQDFFVHITGIVDEVQIKENDEVIFDIIEGKRGMQASNVKKA